MDLLSEFFTFLVTMAFWYVVWSVVIHLLHNWLDSKKSQHAQVVERVNKIVHAVKEEQQGETKYWYDKDSNEFLAQGSTYTELVTNLKARFPGHLFLLSETKMLCGPDYDIVDIDPETIYKTMYPPKNTD